MGCDGTSQRSVRDKERLELDVVRHQHVEGDFPELTAALNSAAVCSLIARRAGWRFSVRTRGGGGRLQQCRNSHPVSMAVYGGLRRGASVCQRLMFSPYELLKVPHSRVGVSQPAKYPDCFPQSHCK